MPISTRRSQWRVVQQSLPHPKAAIPPETPNGLAARSPAQLQQEARGAGVAPIVPVSLEDNPTPYLPRFEGVPVVTIDQVDLADGDLLGP